MSLGIGSLAAVALGNLGVSPAVIAQRVFGGLQSTSIMAIAFFILAGNLMPAAASPVVSSTLQTASSATSAAA